MEKRSSNSPILVEPRCQRQGFFKHSGVRLVDNLRFEFSLASIITHQAIKLAPLIVAERFGPQLPEILEVAEADNLLWNDDNSRTASEFRQPNQIIQDIHPRTLPSRRDEGGKNKSKRLGHSHQYHEFHKRSQKDQPSLWPPLLCPFQRVPRAPYHC